MKRAFFWAPPLVLLLGLVAWRLTTERAAAQETAGQSANRRNAAQAADLAVAGPTVIEKVLDAVGTAESPYKVEIAPKTSGRIEFLNVREGDSVRKGDLLVQLDPSDLEGQLLEQQAALAQARAKLAEAQISKSANDASIEGGYLQQEANLSTAKAELDQAKQSYDAQIADAQAAVVDANARVKAAESDVRNSQARVAAAEADAENSKLRWDRYQRLLKEGYIAGQLVDDARANYTVAQKAVDVAQAQLDGSRSALDSAKAQLKSSEQQLSIAKNRASASVKTAQAKFTQAQSAVRVAKANRSGSAAYSANLDALAAAVKSAQAQLDQAQAKRRDMSLSSSINGTVTARNADPGTMATPGQAILTIQSLDWLFVKASLPIERAGNVKPGQTVRIRFDGFPDRVWDGSIAQVNPSADLQTRQFTFQVRLDNQQKLLRPGMYARIAVPIERVPVQVAVPKTAVTTEAGRATVRVVDKEGEIEVRDVEVGVSNDKLVQIVKGLDSGEKVVALSFQDFREGQKVRTAEAGRSRG